MEMRNVLNITLITLGVALACFTSNRLGKEQGFMEGFKQGSEFGQKVGEVNGGLEEIRDILKCPAHGLFPDCLVNRVLERLGK